MVTSLWSEERMLIGGELVNASDDATFENVNPATEEVIGLAANGSPADMDAAIGAARVAFDQTDWSTNVPLRLRCLRQLHQGLLRHSDELRETIVAEVGTPVILTQGPQLAAPVDGLAWVADLLERYEWETDLGYAEPFGLRSHRMIRREATGVVGAITPWNFPMQINLAKCGPALAAGNSVVLKPAPDTPWSASLLGRIAQEETDLPPGVLNIVTSADHSIGQQLTEDPRVDLVSFTGSTATGRKVMATSAQTVKKVFLELGGKSAYVVLDDADVSDAVGGAAFQITTHAGQGCAVTSRLLLPQNRFDEGVEAVVAVLRGFTCGDPTDPSVMIGPLISDRQRQRVLGYIAKGIEQGAGVALGGGTPKEFTRGYYVEPTVLVGVDRDAVVAQEEIFGPVLVVQAYKDDDDAVALANDSIYGLSGAVVGNSLERARSVARRLRTGTVSINGGLYYSPDVPFGGYRQSGVGREMGLAGFEEYLETKALAEGA